MIGGSHRVHLLATQREWAWVVALLLWEGSFCTGAFEQAWARVSWAAAASWVG